MRRLLLIGVVSFFALKADRSAAQIPITASGLPVTQNFDSLGTSATAALPTGWKMSAVGAGTSAGYDTVTNTNAVSQQASSGTPTAGGRYNWGSSTTDRAPGFMTSSGYASPNAIMAAYVNNTGSTITSITLSYIYERYRINTAAAGVTFFTSTDGSTWTPQTSGDSGAFATGASSYTFSGGTTVPINITLNGLNVANGAQFYVKWVFTNTGNSNSQGLGLDDVSLTADTSVSGAPVITSPLTASVVAFQATANIYQITASNSPLSYGATGLPSGLSVDTSTGVISGTATVAPGTYSVAISATNAQGTGSATLALTVTKNPGAPTITSGLTASGLVNDPTFSYQIVADNTPTSYASGTLPAGLALNTGTGLISGTPTAGGVFNVSITASNALGSDAKTLVITINSPPVITSSLSGSLYATNAFGYTITANFTPTSFGASGLPAGWTVDSVTGAITSGVTPLALGSASFQVSATNAFGATSNTYNLSVYDQAAQDAIPLSVVVNKYVNATPDKVQLLVVGNNTAGSIADMRGMIVKDFSSSMANDSGGKFVFTANTLWTSVRAGTLIALSAGNTQSEDVDPSDFYLAINLGNTNYFSSGGGSFDIGTTDMLMIKAAGSGVSGVAGGIHALAGGSAGAQFTAFTGAKLITTGTSGTDLGVLALNSTASLTNFGTSGAAASTDAQGGIAATNLNFGSWNNTNNQTYIESLRLSVATISATPSTLPNLAATQGTPGASTNFTASASNLSNNITVSANDAVNFAISTNNTDFTNTLTLSTNASGGLSNTSVYVRLTGAAPAGAKSNTVSLVSGTNSANVSVSGTVAPPASPTLTATPSSITNLGTIVGSASVAQSFAVNGTLLSSNVAVSANDAVNFAVSTNNTDFTNTLTVLTNSSGALSNVPVYVRLTGSANGTFNSTVNLTSGSLATNVIVGGVVASNGVPFVKVDPVSLSGFSAVQGTVSANQTVTISGTNLTGPVQIAAPSGFEVSTNGTSFSSSVNILPLPLTPGTPVIFSNSTVWTATNNGFVQIEAWGAGGAGGSALRTGGSGSVQFGGGGAGGAYVKLNAFSVSAGSNYSVNVGLGASNTSDSNQFRFDGADSWFNSSNTVLAKGGQGGQNAIGNVAATRYGAGGIGTTNGSFGDTLFAGGSGFSGWAVTNTTNGTTTTNSGGGGGGSSAGFAAIGTNALYELGATNGPAGSGIGGNGITTGSNPGRAGGFPGGGGGGSRASTNAIVAGGAGGNGKVVLTTLSSAPVLSNTIVYVRMAATAGLGTNTGSLTIASAGASDRTVSLGGLVTPPPPAISVSPTNLPAFSTPLNVPSAFQSFSAGGSYLTSNITVAAPTNFAVSFTNDGTGVTNLLTLATNGSGVVVDRLVFVRMTGASAGSFSNVVALVGGTGSNNVSVSGEVLLPVVTVSTNSLPPFVSVTNQASAAQLFTAGGSNLSTNITVAAPSGFSVAFTTNDADFGSLVTLTNTNGTVTNRDVYVRMNLSSVTNSLGPTNVNLTSVGASNFVTVRGTNIDSVPALTANPASLTNFFTVVGTASTATNFVLAGSNLFTAISVAAPAGFEVALTNTNSAFTNSVSPVASGAGALNTNIWVRVAASAATNTNLAGNVTAASGAASTNVFLRAIVAPVPVLSAVPTALSNFSTVFGVASTNQSFNLGASNLLGPVNLSVTNGYEISLSTNSGFATNLAVAPTSAADNAGNYTSATWTNGANAGAGFGPWVIAANVGSGSAGVFIGNPAAAGISADSNFGTNAFGLYANPSGSGAFVNADRTFPALGVGQTLSFQWAVNFDADTGNKGFNIYAGGTGGAQVLNVNQAGFPGNITLNGNAAVTNYGTNAMTWSFTMTSPTNLLVTSTGRDGSNNIAFTTNIAVSAPPDAFRWYASGMSAGDQRQPYFNNLQIAYTGGNISNLPVYVRIGTNAPVAEATNSLISRVTISSTNATNAYVNLLGTVASNPVITQSNSLVPFSSVQGFPSDPQRFKVGGLNLLTNVLVASPAGYQVSLDGTAWADNTNVPALPKDGIVTPQQDVFIRVASTAPVGSAGGDIVLSSTRASNVLIPVSRVVGGNVGPQLVATPEVLGAFATDLGTNSPSQDFVLTGSGLSNNVALTAFAGFEISTNGTTFVPSAILTPRTSGFISNTIAVRLAGAPPTGILGGNVLAASGTAQALVAVSGTVYQNAAAQIAATPLSLSGFTTVEGTPSVSQPFLASGRQLGSDDLVATASTDYEVSTNDTDFFPSVDVTPVGGSVDPVSFYVRISASATFTSSLPGTVTLSSASAASNVIVSLDGKVDPARPLSVTLLSPSNNPTIIAPGSRVRLVATVSDTNSSGNPVQVANFEFRTNNVAIPGAFVTNVVSPYTLTYDWTPSPAGLPTEVSAWAIDVDGWEGSSASVVVRNPDPGEPVVGFTPPIAYPTNSQIEAVAPATNGAFYIGGSFTNLVRSNGSVAVTNAATRVARILADGTVDTEFITETGPNNTVRTLLYSATNRGLYLGGVFTNVSGVSRPGLARLAVGQTNVDDGTLDTNFAPALGAVSSPIVNAVVQQYDGKILVGGIFTTAGTGTNSTNSANLARFLTNGVRDVSFTPPAPNGEVKSIALQPDGKILIAGSFAQVAGQARKGLARLNIDGTLDTTFTVGTGTSGGFNGTVWSVAVALDGSVYAGGQFSSYNGRSVYNNLAKLSSTGVLQAQFNYAGSLAGGINNVIRNVQMRPGGDILVSGLFTQIANSVLFPTPVAAGRVAQFVPAGTLDAAFNPGGTGANNSVLNASTLANGNLVLVGAFTTYNGQSYPRMLVLSGTSATTSEITSPPFFTVDAGSDFEFSFTSSGSMPYDGLSAGLPRGVSFDAAAGRLSGIPLDAGAFDMEVSATSSGGGFGDPSAFRLQVLPKLVPYDTWKKVWFTPAEQTNATVSGRLVVGQNPSGQPNFTVYALSGGSPKEEGTWILPGAWPKYVEGQQYLAYTVWYYPLSEAFYTVQTTGNLQTNWSTNTISITNGPDFFQVRPTVPMSLTNRQFLRLQISAP